MSCEVYVPKVSSRDGEKNNNNNATTPNTIRKFLFKYLMENLKVHMTGCFCGAVPVVTWYHGVAPVNGRF